MARDRLPELSGRTCRTASPPSRWMNSSSCPITFTGSSSLVPRTVVCTSPRVQLGPSLWETVRTFKAATSTIVRKRIEPAFGWQRGYYDRVIRSEAELERTREYIRSNPEMWVHDTLNPTKQSPTLDGRSL